MSKSKNRGNSILRNDKNAFPRLKERGGEYYIHQAKVEEALFCYLENTLSVVSKVLSENHAIDPADFKKVIDKSFKEIKERAGAKAS